MPVDTLTFQEFVGTTADEQRWQICNAVLEGGSSGGVSNSNVAVASDGTTRSPLNLDSSGRLIVDIGSSVQIDQVLVDLTAVENKQDTSNALLTTIQSDLAGTLNASITSPVSLAGGQSVSLSGGTVTLGAGTANIGNVNPDTTGSGSVTTSTPLVITTTNNGTLGFQSNNAATGTITIEGTVDGTTWTATTYVALTTGNSSSSFNAATPTIGQINTSALQAIRFRSNTITGTCGITYNLSRNVSNVMIDNALPSGSNLIGSVSISTVSGLGTSTLTPAYESIVIPSSFVTGQAKIAVTGTALQLGSNTLTQGVLISALSTNTASITIGTSSSLTNVVNGTGNGAILTAGSTKSVAATNTNLIWINGTAGDIISFIGS